MVTEYASFATASPTWVPRSVMVSIGALVASKFANAVVKVSVVTLSEISFASCVIDDV
jgi:hypothetical protein